MAHFKIGYTYLRMRLHCKPVRQNLNAVIPIFTFFNLVEIFLKVGLFLFIFVLFKHNITEKTVYFSGIQTRIVGVEGECADHLITTTAHLVESCLRIKLVVSTLSKRQRVRE